MKNILLVGKLNNTVKELNAFLSGKFQVQICSESATVLEGMMKIVCPDLVLISLIGAYDVNTSIFYNLSTHYEDIPVITIGTREECSGFLKYYESQQFENLVRPVENSVILEAICRKLDLEALDTKDDESEEKTAEEKKRILVVDDSGVALRTMKAMLDGKYEVAVAISGAQAMTSIGKKRPDLILLDYEMPVCDGRQTFEMIRADSDLADIPVIFLTGVNDRSHIQAVLELHPAGYFLKPPVKERLLGEIEKILNQEGANG